MSFKTSNNRFKSIFTIGCLFKTNKSQTKRIDKQNEIKTVKSLPMGIKNKPLTKKSNKEICLSYLKKYEEKDLDSIEKMFSNDIVLRDWKIRVEDKENAINETRKNFNSADSIAIEVLSIYENQDTVAAELKITVDATEELYVVDVITINTEGKIKSIRAYLGRGDD